MSGLLDPLARYHNLFERFERSIRENPETRTNFIVRRYDALRSPQEKVLWSTAINEVLSGEYDRLDLQILGQFGQNNRAMDAVRGCPPVELPMVRARALAMEYVTVFEGINSKFFLPPNSPENSPIPPVGYEALFDIILRELQEEFDYECRFDSRDLRNWVTHSEVPRIRARVGHEDPLPLIAVILKTFALLLRGNGIAESFRQAFQFLLNEPRFWTFNVNFGVSQLVMKSQVLANIPAVMQNLDQALTTPSDLKKAEKKIRKRLQCEGNDLQVKLQDVKTVLLRHWVNLSLEQRNALIGVIFDYLKRCVQGASKEVIYAHAKHGLDAA